MDNILKKILELTGYKILPKWAITMDTVRMRRFYFLSHLYSKIENVEGNIVECGVQRGRTLMVLMYLARAERKNRDIWGFDSFEGFPEVSVHDTSPRNSKKGELADDVNIDNVYKVLEYSGVSGEYTDKHLNLVKGFFSESLHTYPGEPIALLHIDVDLYQSHKECLEVLVPFVSQGGIVAFDDYGSDKWPGATKAVDEFLKDKPWKIQKHEPTNKHFFIKEG